MKPPAPPYLGYVRVWYVHYPLLNLRAFCSIEITFSLQKRWKIVSKIFCRKRSKMAENTRTFWAQCIGLTPGCNLAHARSRGRGVRGVSSYVRLKMCVNDFVDFEIQIKWNYLLVTRHTFWRWPVSRTTGKTYDQTWKLKIEFRI